MKRILGSLYGRISLLYLALSFALCLFCAWVTVCHFRTFMGAVNQRLDRELAASLVPRVEAAATGGSIGEAVKQVRANIADLRPAVQLYVLDASGHVRGASVASPYLQRETIRMEPVTRFVDGATAPVRAQDPASTTDQKVFSAAPIEGPDGQTDYLYVILNGCSVDAIASTFKQTYVWRTFGSSLLLALGFTTVVGLVLFWALTRRFRSLTHVVQRFKEGDYDQRADAEQDDEIGQLGQAFNEMADTIAAQVEALRRTDEERRRLVAQVSHDFRTPLTSIQGHVERLLDGGPAADARLQHPEEEPEGDIHVDRGDLDASGLGGVSGDGAPPAHPSADQRLDMILQNTKRLSQLAGRLHELSRLDLQGRDVDGEPFSIAELVHDLVVKFRPTAQDRGVTLTADVTPDVGPVRGDIGMIERLLSNLVENAIENTPAGGRVAVRLDGEGASVRVAVEDTGVGMPAEEIPLVTQRFYQVDAGEPGAAETRAATEEGSGLGLAIASEIAKAHGSSLDIESAPDEGTMIVVRLDRAE